MRSSNSTGGFLFAALLFLLLMSTMAAGQSRSRIITSPGCPYDDEALVLEVSNARIAGTEVSFDTPFAANDDWLAQLTFRIVNTGQKPIAAIVITVGLLQGVDEALPTYASFDYGLQLIRKNVIRTKQGRSQLRTLVGPGKEIEITAEGAKPYGLRYMDAVLGGTTGASNWSEFASKVGARFHRVEVMSADVWFTDGSNADAQLLVRTKCTN